VFQAVSGHARVGLPLAYAGAVLAGALQEPATIGPGTLTSGHAAVHETDSSWEVFRLLAIGVVRLLGLPPGGRIPVNLLPIRWLRTGVTWCRLRRTHPRTGPSTPGTAGR
jgi:hypothetical protein